MKQLFTHCLLATAGLLLHAPTAQAQAENARPASKGQRPLPPLLQELVQPGGLGLRPTLPRAGSTPSSLLAKAKQQQHRPLQALGSKLPTTLQTDAPRSLTAGSVNEKWVTRYNSPGNSFDFATDLDLDAAGNVYVTGYSYTSTTSSDYVTVKYSSTGQELWSTRYNGPANTNDTPVDIAVDAAGNVYVTGTSAGTGSRAYATLKYDGATGQQLWVTRYTGVGTPTSRAAELALDAAGNVYITGNFLGTSQDAGWATLKYDGASGQQVWLARYTGSANTNDTSVALEVDAAGAVYVVGQSSNSTNGDSGFSLVKYSDSGQQLWEIHQESPSSIGTSAEDLAIDEAGNVYVAGTSGRDFSTMKYSTSGQLLWEARYNGPANLTDIATNIAVDKAGNVYVTGYSINLSTNPNFGSNSYATLKYSASGQQLWVARYDGPTNSSNMPSRLVVDAAGGVYVTGLSNSNFNSSYATLKYADNGQQLWLALYDGPTNGSDQAMGLGVDAAGNVYVTGSSQNTSGSDFATLQYVAAEAPHTWEARFTGLSTATTDDVAEDVATDAAGNVYVTGYAYNGSNYDYVTIKYAASGQQLWQMRYNGPANGDEVPTDLTVDATGNAYVTGTSFGGSSYDYATVKYSPTGSELWTVRYNFAGLDDVAAAVAVDAAGNVLVTGGSAGPGQSGAADYDYATVKYSASGQQLWATRYGGYPNSSNLATYVAVDAAGSVYVTGATYNGSNYGYATLKYSASGQGLWSATYSGDNVGYNEPTDLVVDAAGDLVVTGSSILSSGVNDGGIYDYATVKYAGASGQQQWVARYNGPANSHDIASDLAVDAAGNVYVTGASDSGSSYDYATVKYSASGQQQWASRYNGSANSYDQATALAVDGGGNVYVTGLSYNADGTDDYATLKYASASGQQVWEARYNGSGSSYDEAAAVAVDATGNAYVTGFSFGNSSGYDYATLKYARTGEAASLVGTSGVLAVAAAKRSVQELAVYPNPASGPTTISFRPVLEGLAQVLVYNQLGQQVATLYAGMVRKGQRYELPLNSQQLAPGLYTCALLVNGQRETVRLLINR